MMRTSIALAWASTLGIDGDALLQAARRGLAGASSDAGSYDDVGVWDALERITGNPVVGLRAGEALRVDQLGPVGPAFVHAENVAAAIDVLTRLLPHLMPGAAGERLETADGGGLLYSTTLRSHHGTDAVLAATLATLRDSSGTRLVPTGVELEASLPGDAEPYATFFGVRPIWGASRNALLFTHGDLMLPLRGSAPAVSELLVEHAPALLAEGRGTSRLEQELVHAFWRAHERRNATLAGIARAMKVSPRTLQRRLSEHGLVFASLRDGLLRARADDLVRDETLSLDAIAEMLGYGSRGSFERAFERWHGTSPARVRARRWK